MAVTDLTAGPSGVGLLQDRGDDTEVARQRSKFTEDALERHKREGMILAVKARIVAMAVIAVMILFFSPWPSVLYYEALIGVYVLIGLAHRRVATVGQNRWEMLVLFCDLALMTLICLVPNPFDAREWPLAFQYRFGTFIYFFVILAMATLSYSWRTIVAVGTWTAGLWAVGALGIWAFRSDPEPSRSAVAALYPDNEAMAMLLDPAAIVVNARVQEAVVFLIVAVILAISVRRSRDLLMAQAAIERERANLARYFSPNVVDQLSNNDDPLKQVAEQEIAVLFVDIVGFTAFAAARTPQEVIRTLREFHALMEREVFRQNGTLDKYLGDGLMATFGTPVAGETDALDALRCARAMARAVDDWNRTRAAAGLPEIRANYGLHAGPVVLGDIGANRLEFAVIGNTVNVASRLEALTRPLGLRLAASDALVARARSQAGGDESVFAGLAAHDGQEIRGVTERLKVWGFA